VEFLCYYAKFGLVLFGDFSIDNIVDNHIDIVK